MHKIFSVILFFSLMACKSGQEKKAEYKKYFDLIQFGEQEKASLEGDTTGIFEKRVTVNGKCEVKKMNKIEWDTDLELLREFDINKPSWQSSFSQTETVLPNGQLIRIIATDSMPQVKEVKVVKNQSGKVMEVYAIRCTKNFLYELTQSVHYFTDSLYQLKSSQKIWLLGDKKFFMEIKFLK